MNMDILKAITDYISNEIGTEILKSKNKEMTDFASFSTTYKSKKMRISIHGKFVSAVEQADDIQEFLKNADILSRITEKDDEYFLDLM